MRVRLTPLSFQNSYGSVKERVQSLSLRGAYLTKRSRLNLVVNLAIYA